MSRFNKSDLARDSGAIVANALGTYIGIQLAAQTPISVFLYFCISGFRSCSLPVHFPSFFLQTTEIFLASKERGLILRVPHEI